MQFQSGINNNMLNALLTPSEPTKSKDDEELEIERKYYKKPDMSTDPLQAGNFLRSFVQGMMQKMGEFDTSFQFLQDFLRQDQQGLDFMQEIPGYIDPRTGMVIREDEEIAKAYNKLIPEGLRDKYKREADIDKYLKNIERLRKRGLV